MHKENNPDKCFFYLLVITIGILGAIAVVIKAELNLIAYAFLGLIVIISLVLVLIFKSVKQQPIQTKFTSIHILPCRKGFIKKDEEGHYHMCHRCVPFHGSVWISIATIIITSMQDLPFGELFYNHLMLNLGEVGYLILSGLLLCSIPIEAVPARKLKKESKNVFRWITSILTSIGISLLLTYGIQKLSILQP